MLNDSERFAFLPRRLHAFETTGNAYDAVQTDDQIKSGDTLIILTERVVGVAYAWPLAVTAEAGKLHPVAPKAGETMEQLAKTFSLSEEDLTAAIIMARALGFDLDPSLPPFAAPAL